MLQPGGPGPCPNPSLRPVLGVCGPARRPDQTAPHPGSSLRRGPSRRVNGTVEAKTGQEQEARTSHTPSPWVCSPGRETGPWALTARAPAAGVHVPTHLAGLLGVLPAQAVYAHEERLDARVRLEESERPSRVLRGVRSRPRVQSKPQIQNDPRGRVGPVPPPRPPHTGLWDEGRATASKGSRQRARQRAEPSGPCAPVCQAGPVPASKGCHGGTGAPREGPARTRMSEESRASQAGPALS